MVIRASAPHPLSVPVAVFLALLLTVLATPARAQIGNDGTIGADPTSIPADGTATSEITVTVTASGLPTAGGDVVTLSTTLGSLSDNDPLTAGNQAADNGNGTYTATLTSSTTAGTATISGTVNGTAMSDDEQVAFTATALDFQIEPSDTQAGVTMSTVQVRATGASGTTDAAFNGTITVALGNNPGGDGVLDGTTTRTATSGVATFDDLKIDEVDSGYTLIASATDLTSATSASFDITPGALATLTFVVQPDDEPAGQPINPAVTVRAEDAVGNDLQGVVVTMTVASGPGSFSGASTLTATTNSSGIATFNNLRIDTPGAYTIEAESSAVSSGPSASFDITPGPPVASQSTITAAPEIIVADGTSTSTITVEIEDAFGNPTAGSVLVSTSAGTFSGGCTSNCPASSTPTTGRYTATLRSTTTAQTATVTGTVNGQAITDNATVTFASGNASRLQFQQQPTSAVSGATISPAVTVRAVDSNNNTVATFNGSVTLSIGNDPGGGALSGTTTRTAVNGVATFNDLSIDKAGTGYTLVADGGGLAGTTSNAFNITPGAPSGATSTISAAPDAIPADGTSTSTITVQLRDANGNSLTSGGAVVTLSASAGTLGSVTDNGNGTYTAVLRSSTGSQIVSVTGTVDGQPIADTASVTFTSGSAASLQILVQPSATPAGQAITPSVRVQVVDAGGNTATDFAGGIAVALGENPTGAVLGGTLTVAAVDGVATFGNLTIDRAGNGYVLRFTSTGVASVNSTPFSITAGDASPSTTTIVADPISIPANGSSTSAITVQLKDAEGSDVRTGGDTVTLSTTVGTLGSVTDNGDGTYVATLTSSTVGATATIRGMLNGAPIVDTATVTFTSGTADLSVTVQVSDDDPVPGGTVVYTVTVQNRGPDAATQVQVTDDLPHDRLSFVSAEASLGTYSGASGVWSLDTLASGASATLEITMTVNP